MEHFYTPQEVGDKFSEIDGGLDSYEKRLKRFEKLISVVGVVLAISFVTFIIDAFMFHFDEKKRLYDKLEQRDKDTQELKEEILKLKIFSINTDTLNK